MFGNDLAPPEPVFAVAEEEALWLVAVDAWVMGVGPNGLGEKENLLLKGGDWRSMAGLLPVREKLSAKPG